MRRNGGGTRPGELDALAQRLGRRLEGLERRAQASVPCPGPPLTAEKARDILQMILEADEARPLEGNLGDIARRLRVDLAQQPLTAGETDETNATVTTSA